MINIVSIVGASGFIGREVVDYFIENKIIVKILIDSQSKLKIFKDVEMFKTRSRR